MRNGSGITFYAPRSVTALLLLLLVSIDPVVGQGCAMCYQNAAAAGATSQAGLRHGILILLIPALGLFGGILALIYRRRGA